MPQYMTVMRKWNDPSIKVYIDEDEINIKMTLADFMQAVRTEIGGVTWTFTKEAFNDQFNRAFGTVVSAMKKETSKVIS